MIGQTLSHYRLVRRLGAGGMGEVYEAEDTDLRRKVALKILPKEMAAKPATLERFKLEARAVAALNHPNIVTIYSVEQAAETHFLTMELVEGRPLSELIPPGGFELGKLFALGIPLTDALAAAHAKGIGHRDLKPSNVMVNEQGRVKVIDFGLAKLFQQETEIVDREAPTVQQTLAGQILGTPAYMSPEQIEGRKLDHRTDIFSLGVLLCEMATARRPFTGDSAISIMSAILRDAPSALAELKPGLPEHLGRIIRRCLQKNPDERYQSALDLRNELKGLEEETRTGSRPVPTVPGELTKEVPLPARPYNLPAQLTSFVGRVRETAEVTRLIVGASGNASSGTRLLTLTGPGGTGKTRLALQVAAGLMGHFIDGVWLVELAALSDPSLVPQTVITAMGLINTAGQPPLELLTRFLGPKQALLLLDNCEHLVVACAELADALLRVCPRLHILATSREGLRLIGETTWLVPTLSVPSLDGGNSGSSTVAALGQYESVKLFVERARTVAPAFGLTEQNAAAVAQLCHRLDGIPLAIELAAARTRLLPVEQLLDRVQDRFHLLTGGSRTALPRQQTLRALVDWSYDLLSPQERLLFDRLSVFAGGWTLEAAEEVCADGAGGRKVGGRGAALRSDEIVDLLGHLLEKSMVVGEASTDGTARYRLLETLRQYGQERLTQGPEAAVDSLRTRHATYFVAFGEQLAVGVRGPDQLKWADRFEIELDNIRAGLDWGKAADAPPDRVDLGLRLAAALYIPSMRRGYSRETRRHLESLLAQRSAQRPTRTRARALFAFGSFAMWQDRDDVTAWALLNESLSLAGQLGDTRVMADARRNLGAVLYNRGDKAGARQRYEEALQLSRADGDLYGIRWSLEDLGDMAADEGNTAHAENLFENARSLARQIGDLFGIASILQCMGNLARTTGKAKLAGELIKEALAIFMQTQFGQGARIAWCFRDLAFVSGAAAAERAVRLLSAAQALQEKSGIVTPTVSVGPVEQVLGEARHQLGEAAYGSAWSEGRAMSLSQATAYALGPAAAID